MNKNYQITKANALIEAKYKLTLEEQRLILFMVSLIHPNDEDFKPYKIKVSDIVNLLNLKNKEAYRRVKNTTLNLLKKTLVIDFKDPDRTLMINWLSSAEYFHKEGFVELCFDPKLKPYLLKLKNYFTTYKLGNIIRLKSIYSIRLYELLKENYSLNKKVIFYDLKVLKEILGIQKNEFKLFGNFNKILKKAQKELFKNSDLTFEYQTVKTGRKVTGIEFTVIKNPAVKLPEKPMPTNSGNDEDIVATEIYKKLIVWISPEQAEKFITQKGVEYCQRNYKKFEKEHERGKLENPAGFLISALSGDFAYESPFEAEKRTERERKIEAEKRRQVEKRHIEELRKRFQETLDKKLSEKLDNLTEFEKDVLETKFKEDLEKKKGIIYNRYIEGGISKVQTTYKIFAQQKLFRKGELDFVEWANKQGVAIERTETGEYKLLQGLLPE